MKLTYLDGYGRGEQIRLLLTYVKQEFEDQRVSFEEVAKLRESGQLEFGQVPQLEWDGIKYVQSSAILRAIGANNGLYSSDPITMWKIDSLVDHTTDTANVFYQAFFIPDEAQKKEKLAAFVTGALAKYMGALESRLKTNSSQKHLVGDKETIADFSVLGFIFAHWANPACPLQAQELEQLEKFPLLKAYTAHYTE